MICSGLSFLVLTLSNVRSYSDRKPCSELFHGGQRIVRLRANSHRPEQEDAHGLDLVDVDIEAELLEARELDLLERSPVAADIDTGLARALLLVPPAAAATLEAATAALVPSPTALVRLVAHTLRTTGTELVRAALPEELAVRPARAELTTAAHLARTAAATSESAARLSGGLLGAGSARDDGEGGLVLVVVVGKGAGRGGAVRLLRLAAVLALLLRSGGVGRALCVPVDDAAELVVLGEGGVGDVLELGRQVRRGGAEAALVVVDYRRDEGPQARHAA